MPSEHFKSTIFLHEIPNVQQSDLVVLLITPVNGSYLMIGKMYSKLFEFKLFIRSTVLQA